MKLRAEVNQIAIPGIEALDIAQYPRPDRGSKVHRVSRLQAICLAELEKQLASQLGGWPVKRYGDNPRLIKQGLDGLNLGGLANLATEPEHLRESDRRRNQSALASVGSVDDHVTQGRFFSFAVQPPQKDIGVPVPLECHLSCSH